MESERKFFKQTIIVTVLFEGCPLEWDSLDDLAKAIDYGDSVGQTKEAPMKCLTPKEAADALYMVGSDPSFFQLSDDGSDLL